MKLSTFAAFALSLLLLSGCASEPTRPDWIAGDSAQYQRAQYLIGHGQANTLEEAKDRARADVSKIFQVAVVVSSEDMQRAKSDSSGAMQLEQQATRNISTRTEQIISGIQIAEIWQDPTSASYHVLAVLPRLQTATTLRQQIGELDATTRNHIEQSRNETDLFMKIAAASRAMNVQQERESLQKNLQVVDITGRGVESQLSSAKLKTDLFELLKRVSIAPQVMAESPAGLHNIVSGALAQSGFVLDTSGRPEFFVRANMTLTDLGLKDGWYWQRGTLQITLIETANNRVRGTRNWSVKGNAQNQADATRRAMDQADAILKQELGGAIIGMAIAK